MAAQVAMKRFLPALLDYLTAIGASGPDTVAALRTIVCDWPPAERGGYQPDAEALAADLLAKTGGEEGVRALSCMADATDDPNALPADPRSLTDAMSRRGKAAIALAAAAPDSAAATELLDKLLRDPNDWVRHHAEKTAKARRGR